MEDERKGRGKGARETRGNWIVHCKRVRERGESR